MDLGDPGWDVDAEAGRLTAGERERAARGVPAVRRRRVLVRAGLRQVLGELLQLRPEAVPIEQVDGRPVVGGPPRRRRFQVSCSASGSVALIGVTAGIPIGVDVEQIGDEDVPTAVGEGWLSARERALIERLPLAEQPRALTRAWVHKEAVVKGRGVGLRADLARTVTPVADRGRVGGWTVEPISVGAGHVACLALRPGSLRMRPFRPVVCEMTP
jgi:4'-phosphopantetheinyl transferase